MDYIIQLNYYNYLDYNDYIRLLITTKKYYNNIDYNNDLIYKYYLIHKFSNKFVNEALAIIDSYYKCLSSIIIFEKKLRKYGYPLWSENIYYAYWKHIK
tara:strand:+ start:154 stop:450 length:297 start_codon:yes stop_codon:yes gene_type:complete